MSSNGFVLDILTQVNPGTIQLDRKCSLDSDQQQQQSPSVAAQLLLNTFNLQPVPPGKMIPVH